MDMLTIGMLMPRLESFRPHAQTWYAQWSSPDLDVILDRMPNETTPRYTGMRLHHQRVSSENALKDSSDPRRFAALFVYWEASSRPLFLKIDTDTLLFPTRLEPLLRVLVNDATGLYFGTTERTYALPAAMFRHYFEGESPTHIHYIQGGFTLLNRRGMRPIARCVRHVATKEPYPKPRLVSEDSIVGLCAHSTGVSLRSSTLISPYSLVHPECSKKASIHLVKRRLVERFKNCSA